MKEPIRDFDNARSCTHGIFDLANDVDVVNLFAPGDVEAAGDLLLDAAGNDAAKVAGIERLAHVAAMAGYGKHRHFLHEA